MKANHLFLLGALAAWLAAAQTQGAIPEERFTMTRWTVDDGLPQNSVKTLVQTHDGYLWIGTLDGLARFDGIRFTHFNHSNTPELTHDPIDHLLEDPRDHALWIATEQGLLRYRDHRFQRFGIEQGIGQVGRIWLSDQGGVLVLGKDAIVHVVGDTVQSWPCRSPLGLEWQSIVETGPSALWGTSNFTLYEINLTTGTMEVAKVHWAARCASMLKDETGTVWAWADGRLWRAENSAWVPVTAATSPPLAINQLYRTGAQIWGTSHGLTTTQLYQLRDGALVRFAPPELAPDANLTCPLIDREGNTWVGTSTGLLGFQRRSLRVYSVSEGLQHGEVEALTGHGQTVWFGTAAGVSVLRDGEIRNLALPPGVAGWGHSCKLLADREDRLWLNWMQSPLFRFSQERWEELSLPPEVQQIDSLNYLYQDREGRFWAATQHKVLCQDQGRWVQYTRAEGLTHDNVRVLFEDRRGDMWFGTYDGGLSRLHDGRMTSYATSRGALNNRSWWIHEDADGIFWVASQEGLNRFVPPDPATPDLTPSANRFFTFDQHHGLREPVVNNIQEDDYGYLWLSGLHGIYRVSRQELNEVARGACTDANFVAYGAADGMRNSECNGGDLQPSGFKSADGQIWFPTLNGAVVVDPAAIRQNQVPPPLTLEQIIADGAVVFGDLVAEQSLTTRENGLGAAPSQSGRVGQAAQLRIAPGQARVLEIRYTANSFVSAHHVLFKYRLVGYDRDWQWDRVNRRAAFYTNLRPGQYSFQVTACNSHGIWAKKPLEFSFYVAPHFWQTWPFYLLCSTGATGLALGAHRYRLRWQRRLWRVKQQHALANERTRIARDLHDDLGTSLTGLALDLDGMLRHEQASANAERLAASAQAARDMAERMREVVWAVNPNCDNVLNLALFLEEHALRFLDNAGIRCRLEFPEELPKAPMSAESRHQLLLVVRESLTNIVRHSTADAVLICFTLEPNSVRIEIEDNGQGFNIPHPFLPGHGLANMEERLRSVGGEFSLQSDPGSGTRARFWVPLLASSSNQPADTEIFL